MRYTARLCRPDGWEEIFGAYSGCLLPYSQKNGTLLVYLD